MEGKSDIIPGLPSAVVTPGPSQASVGTARVGSEPRILVVIANYGNGNDVHLSRLLAEFRSMRLRVNLHVLSDQPKDWGRDVSMHVGLPTGDPHSLPFGHRRVFADHLSEYEFFIYCEDDTLITEKNIRAFLEVNEHLQADEIPGFLRVERFPNGECYMESAHGPYRWEPASLVQRGSLTFAAFTNPHSAFNMASQAQLRRAIDSKGFLVKPHVGRAGMLECAATDIYTQCGLKRLICISKLEEFLVPHLSNANTCKWGLRYEEFHKQTQALQQLASNGEWTGSLMEVETRTPRGLWSKNLYERPDSAVLGMIPPGTKTILSVGAGWGATEELLVREGKHVVALAVDGVFEDCQRRRGIETIAGPFDSAITKLGGRRFDVILMLDVIHLLPDPVHWLSVVRTLTNPGSTLLASVPRTFDPLRMIWYLRGEPPAVFPKCHSKTGIQKVNHSRLAGWLKTAGWAADIEATCNTPLRIAMQMKTGGFAAGVLADRFMVQATSGGGT